MYTMGNCVKYGKSPLDQEEEFPMGNKGFDKEEILDYVKNGWHFRVKTVKRRRYITRRKGQKERSMGPFNPDLWSTITMLVHQTAEEKTSSTQEESVLEKGTNNLPKRPIDWIKANEEFNIKFERLNQRISLYRGIEMRRNCIHKDKEDYCTYWNWEEEPDFFGLLDELLGSECYEKRRISKKGLSVDRWMVKAFQWYCSSCPVYQTLKE